MKIDKGQENAGVSTPWVDYFRPYGIPPSPLHEALQKAAMQAGWIPPWDHIEQQNEKVTAGKQSGYVRANRAAIRRYFVKFAFGRLKPANQMQPYSGHSLNALEAEYRRLLAEDGGDPDVLMSAAPFKMDRQTLIKDLKALGIQSKRRKQSGNEIRSTMGS
jgi:hypothetical protein